MLIEPARCHAIFDQVADAARALGIADVEAIVAAGSSALTRFANNAIHQNVAEHTLGISVRAVVDGRTARATSSSASPSAAANRCKPRTAISARAADTGAGLERADLSIRDRRISQAVSRRDRFLR